VGNTELISKNENPYVEANVENFRTYRITISGNDLAADAVGTSGGKNIIYLVPITNDGSVYNSTANDIPTQSIANTEITIDKADLNYKLESVSTTAITWSISVPTGADNSAFSAEKGAIRKTKYRITELAGDKLISLEPDSTKWKFKVHNGDNDYYIKAQAPSDGSVSSTPVNSFSLSKVSGTVTDTRYRILGGSQFLTWEGERGAPADMLNGTRPFQLISQLDLTESQADNSVVNIVRVTTPSTTTPAAGPYVYKFEVKDVSTAPTDELGPHISDIKVDGKSINADKIEFDETDRRNDLPYISAYDGDNNTYVSWKKRVVDDVFMTITLPTKPNTISVAWFRQKYRPNFKIYENDALIITESGTRASTMKSGVSEDNIKNLYTEYDIKNRRVYTSSPGFNRSFGLIGDKMTNNNSLSAVMFKDTCKTACDNDDKCFGFGFASNGNECYLKKLDGLGGYEPTDAWTFHEKSA